MVNGSLYNSYFRTGPTSTSPTGRNPHALSSEREDNLGLTIIEQRNNKNTVAACWPIKDGVINLPLHKVQGTGSSQEGAKLHYTPSGTHIWNFHMDLEIEIRNTYVMAMELS